MNPKPKKPSKKLSKNELLILSNFLTKYELIPLIELHGFLTAVVSAPDYTEPAEWLDALDILKVSFRSDQEGEKIHTLLAKLYFEITKQLETHSFSPLLSCDSKETFDDALLAAAYGRWADGYMEAISWDEKAWDAENMKEISPLIMTISSLTENDGPGLEKELPPLETRLHAIADLPAMVMNIYDYWRRKEENEPLIQ